MQIEAPAPPEAVTGEAPVAAQPRSRASRPVVTSLPVVRQAARARIVERAVPAAMALAVLLAYELAALTTASATSGVPIVFQTKLDHLIHWDGYWYSQIAASGYHIANVGTFSAPAFFPLYPLVINALHRVFPFLSLFSIGILVNLTATCAAVTVVERALDHLGWSLRQRLLTVGLLLTLPGAFFYGMYYSEALFFLAAAVVVSGFLRDRMLLASAGVAVACLDRPTGALLLLLLVPGLWRRRQHLSRVVGLVAVAGSGLVAVVVAMWAIVGSPLAPFRAEAAWAPYQLYRLGPGGALHLAWTEMFLRHNAEHVISLGFWEVALAVPLIVLCWHAGRSWAIASAAMWVTTVAAGGDKAFTRYLLVIIPLWIGVLMALRKWEWRWLWPAVAVAIPVGFAINLELARVFARWGGVW